MQHEVGIGSFTYALKQEQFDGGGAHDATLKIE